MDNPITIITLSHCLYLLGVVIILLIMILKKDIVIPCLIFIFLISAVSLKSVTGGVQTIFNSLLFSGRSFFDVMLTISLIYSMSRCLADIGSDYVLIKPSEKAMKNPYVSYWIIGFVMLISSWFIWPSPSVALIGALLIPVSNRIGLPAISAAMAMNIFGHGIALSSDIIIQGAPNITAINAGTSSSKITLNGIPLFLIMGIVTSIVGFYIACKDIKSKIVVIDHNKNLVEPEKNTTKLAVAIAALTIFLFIVDIVCILIIGIKGGEATALVTGTAVIIMVVGAIAKYKVESMDKITSYLREGFNFSLKVFTPVIVIGAFFLIGGSSIGEILGPSYKDSNGFMNDWARWLSNNVILNKYYVIFIQSIIAFITGLDGSGFSGLPIVGSLAGTFGGIININTDRLAALGQLITIWVGGGVLIPWSLAPVAAICEVDPIDLARKNFWPVVIGLIVTIVISLFII